MKFSVVTPVYNCSRYFEETAMSIAGQQGDFDIEFIVVDGGSTDGTWEKILDFQKGIHNKTIKTNCRSFSIKVSTGKDHGMYDAINKGFDQATGDIYSYLNADDIYTQDAFSTILNTFQITNAAWVKGITSYIDEFSNKTSKGLLNLYHRRWIGMGVYGQALYFIQQDSVFWKKELWNSVRGIDINFKYAGDMYLWCEFSKYSDLISVNKEISFFRVHEGQLSSAYSKYLSEVSLIKFDTMNWLENKKLYFLTQLYSGRLKGLPVFIKKLFFVLIFPLHRYTYFDPSHFVVKEKRTIWN